MPATPPARYGRRCSNDQGAEGGERDEAEESRRRSLDVQLHLPSPDHGAARRLALLARATRTRKLLAGGHSLLPVMKQRLRLAVGDCRPCRMVEGLTGVEFEGPLGGRSAR